MGFAHNIGVTVVQTLTESAPDPEEPLFAEDILVKAAALIEAQILYKAVKNPNAIILEIRQVLRKVFLRQAEYRNVNTHGLGELVDQIEVCLDPDPSRIVLNTHSEVLSEIDRYLYNRRCHVCGMKIPGSTTHEQIDCDEYLVEDLMSE